MYFDHASTTRPSHAVLGLSMKINRELYANPASLHMLGVLAEGEIISSARKLARLIGAAPEEIVYTSGATEANNLAVFGVCETARRGLHVITTRSEHPSVSETCRRLLQKGYEVTWLATDIRGSIDYSALEAEVRPDTVLVSLMHVNNETGTVCDIARAAGIVKAKNPDTIFHSDGVQAFGKFPVVLRNIDLYSMSAHKIHGLRGAGALYVKKGTRLQPQIYGGGQQRGMRSGTENTAGICSFTLAALQMYENIEANFAHVSRLKALMMDIDIEDVCINGETDGSPYILNMSFLGVKAETLLHSLEHDGIYASIGAACGSKNSQNILRHYGLRKERVESALRFSFSHENTSEEVETAKESIVKYVRSLRRVGGRK